MPAASETLTHRRRLCANYFGLDSCGKSFSLVQRQAERFRNSAVLPFDPSDFDLSRRPITRIGHKLHPPHQLLHTSIPLLNSWSLAIINLQASLLCKLSVQSDLEPSLSALERS